MCGPITVIPISSNFVLEGIVVLTNSNTGRFIYLNFGFNRTVGASNTIQKVEGDMAPEECPAESRHYPSVSTNCSVVVVCLAPND
jgi:hypothetical protein